MSQPQHELEAWLTGRDLAELWTTQSGDESWEAGFEPDRQVVLIKLGPFRRLFLRPDDFTKRFYHQLFPLSIESWPQQRQLKLFDDFCTLDITLDLHFQATLKYVQKNAELLGAINQHIKKLYAGVIEDIIQRELISLADGQWVREGLMTYQRRIEREICEFLSLQHIQSQATCEMTATFVDFPDVQLGKDSVYVNVLRKMFELAQEKSHELARQQRITHEHELKQQHTLLQHQQHMLEIERQAQAQQAELQLQLLLDKENQLARQREIELRLHAEQVRHEQNLNEIRFDVESAAQQQLDAKRRLMASQLMADELAHEAFVADQKVQAEIERRQAAQRRWQLANLEPDAAKEDSDQDTIP